MEEDKTAPSKVVYPVTLTLWAYQTPSMHSVDSPDESDEGKLHEDAGVQVTTRTQPENGWSCFA